MNEGIAIVGMACRYPDARSPRELWENVLAQRRAFRRIPAERLSLDDYHSPDRAAEDQTYSNQAAVIEGYEFDRVRFRVVGSTFRSADLAHWLALEVAADALGDAGFADAAGLPREMTGVLLGNSLTGEFSRANLMRLRWPYVRRVLDAALAGQNWSAEQRGEFLAELEGNYKAPFPSVGEETLAGGLSNTIAGRICNHFDFKGGGYTVDGACAASLLAVTNACTALTGGDLDVALAGGVDLSLDPFELVGFAKTGALATDDMRVYDVRSGGFWPGEGCGFVVLMRHADAMAQQRRIYAVIRGWGISSDGAGGITRPEFDGQFLAVKRAYARAGFGIDSVAYFEGHGTGTQVGDATELRVLSTVRRQTNPGAPPAVIGSIKANIGHTKAAAGVAGLIKATMALHQQLLPPTTGCSQPHGELSGDTPALTILRQGEAWPPERELRAGVSAMGFGGINTHLALEAAAGARRVRLGARERDAVESAQDAELFLFDAHSTGELRATLNQMGAYAARLSRAELTDLAAELATRLDGRTLRAALVASAPQELADRLTRLSSWLDSGLNRRIDPEQQIFLGSLDRSPRIGFVFPGQGSPAHADGGFLRRRFRAARDCYASANLPAQGDYRSTALAQPAIVTASTAGLRVLSEIGVEAQLAVGHSLGELTALSWAGAIDQTALLRIATARGKAMYELGSPTGAMASIGGGQKAVQGLIGDVKESNGKLTSVVIAGLNSPQQTVISGDTEAIEAIAAQGSARGWSVVRLPVSHAFHSALVAAAVPALNEHLQGEEFARLQRLVCSTVTGDRLAPDADLRDLLCRQVTSPVRFVEAVAAASAEVDLWIEVGPGSVLTGLLRQQTETPIIATDAAGPSLSGILSAAGAAFAAGAPLRHDVLFDGRLTRPFNLDWQPKFLVNPCELAPKPDSIVSPSVARRACAAKASTSQSAISSSESAIEVVRRIVMQRTELPAAAVRDDHRLLGDLHLNSITVGQIVVEAARNLSLRAPAAVTDYAGATLAGVAAALEDLARTGQGLASSEDLQVPAGVDTWIRPFTIEWVEQPLPGTPARSDKVRSAWRIVAPPEYRLRAELQSALDQAAIGRGVVVCVPVADDPPVELLLEAARKLLDDRGSTHFVLVQRDGAVGGFARTLHLEHPEMTTCVIDIAADDPHAVERILAEVSAAAGFVEARYDRDGRRHVPVLRLLPEFTDHAALPLTRDDVWLVTGGGKGIAAECALALARETGATLALLGRSLPEDDAELAANLARMAAAGIRVAYFSADVTDRAAVEKAIRQAQERLGPVTAVLHGAGANVPALIEGLTSRAFAHTLAPKLNGLRHMLGSVDPQRLRLLVTFGSIIARTGLHGEADYAVGNEQLARMTRDWQRAHPECRCLCIEWSVWSGVGMGERLGRIDALRQQGITAISPDEGVRALRQLLARLSESCADDGSKFADTSVVVTGRFGDPPTLKLQRDELPLLRFLERPRVHYPGVELVVDVRLSTDGDPYLNDHVLGGERLLPAVMGLEAMAQVVMALTSADAAPSFADVKLHRPVVVPNRGSTIIRVAALVRGPDRVDVVLRSEETGFSADHFAATCHWQTSTLPAVQTDDGNAHKCLPLDPTTDLYGHILFHSGRFRRVSGYRRLSATECCAELTPSGLEGWFGQYLPGRLMLGDAALRDAAIHGIQACIPHMTILPIGVERIERRADLAPVPCLLYACERSRAGRRFVYDMELRTLDGHLIERWDGLQLQGIERSSTNGVWAEALLGPYVERRVGELIPQTDFGLLLERQNGTPQESSTDAVLERLTGEAGVVRRPDGKPELNGHCVSAAHAADLTLAVAGSGRIGCDIEFIEHRSHDVWRDLLGSERWDLAELLAREFAEDSQSAATRVWVVSESLKKAGARHDQPLKLHFTTPDGWALLSAGALSAATLVTSLRGSRAPLALAIVLNGGA